MSLHFAQVLLAGRLLAGAVKLIIKGHLDKVRNASCVCKDFSEVMVNLFCELYSLGHMPCSVCQGAPGLKEKVTWRPKRQRLWKQWSRMNRLPVISSLLFSFHKELAKMQTTDLLMTTSSFSSIERSAEG